MLKDIRVIYSVTIKDVQLYEKGAYGFKSNSWHHFDGCELKSLLIRIQ